MGSKRYGPEKTLSKLREAEVLRCRHREAFGDHAPTISRHVVYVIGPGAQPLHRNLAQAALIFRRLRDDSDPALRQFAVMEPQITARTRPRRLQ